MQMLMSGHKVYEYMVTYRVLTYALSRGVFCNLILVECMYYIVNISIFVCVLVAILHYDTWWYLFIHFTICILNM